MRTTRRLSRQGGLRGQTDIHVEIPLLCSGGLFIHICDRQDVGNRELLLVYVRMNTICSTGTDKSIHIVT